MIQILIVEDNIIIAKGIQLSLEKMGYDVPFIVATGSEAVEKVRDNKIDLVLMDIVLPGGMDGIEAAEQIQTLYKVPVVYLTAHTDEATLKRAKITAPYGYLVKPVSESEMRSTIEMAIYRFRMERELRESEEKYSVLVETAQDGVVIVYDEVFKFANNAMTKIIGYSLEEFIGMNIMDIVVPEYRQMVAGRYRTLMESNPVPGAFEFKILCKDGKTKFIELAAGRIQYKGKPAAMGIVRDITERKVTEEELKKHREQLCALVEERTAELTEANMLLQHEIAEREILEKAILDTEERELRRIGCELHDGLGQLLTAISLKSHSLEDELGEKSMPEAESAKRITFLIDKAKEHLRYLMQGNFPMEKDQKNIVSLLEELASRITRDSKLTCRFKYDKPVTIKNEAAVIHLYRIAQEAATNAAKHSGAEFVELDLSHNNDLVTLTVNDNGKGIPELRSRGNGMGLKIMKYRANKISTSFNISSTPGRGTIITCTYNEKFNEELS